MAATPMMAQYLELKAEAGDALLFYRMGDFYELFFADAEAAAAALDIALTKRGQHEGRDVPMCGVPVHAADSYLTVLIRKGFRVAVCEQLETPELARRRGSKALVRRGIVRLVTPGTLTEDALLDARVANHLAAWTEIRGDGALAWCDISTGVLRVTACPTSRLGAELARIGVRELLLAEGEAGAEAEAREAGATVTPLGRSAFDSASAQARLQETFAVGTLEGFGSFARAELGAMGALVEYVELTQRGLHPHLRPPRRERDDAAMRIDAPTRRSLEILRGPEGRREGSLLAVIDRTVTAAGGRLMEARLAAPSRDLAEIDRRLDAIGWAVGQAAEMGTLREALRGMPDMARALQRLSVRRGGPRDLGALRDGLSVAARLATSLEALAPPFPGDLRALDGTVDIRRLLSSRLAEALPARLGEGATVAMGVCAELDAARRLRDHGHHEIAQMQARYAEAAGVPGLRIRHNKVLGYFVEVTATHKARMEAQAELFVHRQSTASLLRFTTLELVDLERRIASASADVARMEEREVLDLSAAALDEAEAIHAAADVAAMLDVVLAMATLVGEGGWTRPCVERGRAFEIRGGRHPVVERALRREGTPFVENDTSLSPLPGGAAIRLVSGPNMGGKSTWLRQNALIAVLAQAGCYVPAQSARVGMVSQLFSRVGASDDLARGRSTFMAEMVETAAILNQADEDAFVILDEIGRGTSTHDGLAIAWASIEHIHDVNRCRTLFATHYHEAMELVRRYEAIEASTLDVRERNGRIVFLHRVRDGIGDRSYGVHVAALAGLPEHVVERAQAVLGELEDWGEKNGMRAVIDDLPLFAPEICKDAAPVVDPVRQALLSLDADALTPRAALETIYELKRLADGP
jgi:DNA mismatch repair protein MutS